MTVISEPKQTLVIYHNGKYSIIEGIHKLPPDIYERYMRNTEEYLATIKE